MPAELLILGGGFAGLAAAGELARRRRRGADISIRLIDRRSYSLFSPLLPDLISARIRPQHACYPLRPHCRSLGVEFTQAEVQRIDPRAGQVQTDNGSFRGESVIVALGCESNYFGDAEMQARSAALKSVDEALVIRSAAGKLCRAARRHSARARPASVVVVGGGYTGFEAASHLADLARAATGVPFRRLSDVVRILIVEKGDEVLRNCSADIRRWAVRLMGDYGVEIRTGVTVAGFSDGGTAHLSDGTVLPRAMVVWAAGVAPGAASASLDVPRRQAGRLAVDEHLRLPGCESAFAAGDVAAPVPPGAAEPLRMSVQFSLAAGRCAAANAAAAVEGRPLRAFRPFDPGYLLPLAPGQAAGQILAVPLRGKLPYLMHYFMCLARSWGWKNRLGMLADLFLGVPDQRQKRQQQ